MIVHMMSNRVTYPSFFARSSSSSLSSRASKGSAMIGVRGLPGGKLAKPRPVSDCRHTTYVRGLPGGKTGKASASVRLPAYNVPSPTAWGKNWQSLGQCPTADEQRMFGDCLGGKQAKPWPVSDCRRTTYVRGLPGGKTGKASASVRLPAYNVPSPTAWGKNWQSLSQCQTTGVQRALADCLGEKLAKPRPVSDCRRTTYVRGLPGGKPAKPRPVSDYRRTTYVRGLPGGKLAKPRPVSDCRLSFSIVSIPSFSPQFSEL